MPKARAKSKLRKLIKRHPIFYRSRAILITRIGTEGLFRTDSANRYIRPEEIPALYSETVRELGLQGMASFNKAMRLALFLSFNHAGGPGLGVTSTRALKAIASKRSGVCSDFSQVFLGLCVTAGIQAREWGTSYDFFSTGTGHSFNEIFCDKFQKWVFVDSYRSFYVADSATGIPLSVSEILHQSASEDGPPPQVVPIDLTQNKRRSPSSFFANPQNFFFLLSKNNIFEQDQILRFSKFIPRSLLHLMLLISGKYYFYYLFTHYSCRELVVKRFKDLRNWKGAWASLTAVSDKPPKPPPTDLATI